MADILARLELRTGTLAAWTSANPILAAGEPGFEVDTNVLRIGDGSTPFLSLPRFQTSDGFISTFQPLADNLTAFAALTFTANKLPYGTGIGSFAMTDLTAEARTFLAAASKAAQRASLELTPAATTLIDASTNMTVNSARLPSRAAVGGAILVVGGPARRILFTASGTFVKADYGAYPDDHMVLVEAWGGGGGGGTSGINRGGGGGGGGYSQRLLRFVDLPTSVAVTIGAGGTPGSAGGNTQFGTLVTAYGGGASASSIWESAGGGGGGEHQAGGSAISSGAGGLRGQIGGGDGGTGTNGPGGNGGSASTPWGGGGGGGGGGVSGVGGAGGRAVFGGGGGAGHGNLGSNGRGVSVRGGNGGQASGENGVAPGGGGAVSGSGARGEVRVWL